MSVSEVLRAGEDNRDAATVLLTQRPHPNSLISVGQILELESPPGWAHVPLTLVSEPIIAHLVIRSFPDSHLFYLLLHLDNFMRKTLSAVPGLPPPEDLYCQCQFACGHKAIQW